MFDRHDARRVSEHTVPGLERRRGRPPASTQTRIEQCLRIRPVPKDGDRRHRAESGRVEHEVRLPVTRDDDHIVRVLVLRDDLHHPSRLLRSAPRHHVAQRAEGFKRRGEGRAFDRIETRVVVQRYRARVRLGRSR